MDDLEDHMEQKSAANSGSTLGLSYFRLAVPLKVDVLYWWLFKFSSSCQFVV